MNLLHEDQTDDSYVEERDPHEWQQPNFAVISILFVAAILCGLFPFMIVFGFLANLEWNRIATLGIPSALYLLFLAACAYKLAPPAFDRAKAKRANVRTADTSKLFHTFQVAVVGTVFGVAYLTGRAGMPEIAWIPVVFETIVGLFYLAYIGFSLARRYPVPKSVYAGFLWIIVCGWYSFQTIGPAKPN